jgi:hypothetical protein
VKQLILLFTIIVANSAILTGCDKAPLDVQQAQKQKQQEAADREALRGEFKKSPGKSY